MILVTYLNKSVLIARTKESAAEYIALHRPALQAKMSIKETRNGAR